MSVYTEFCLIQADVCSNTFFKHASVSFLAEFTKTVQKREQELLKKLQECEKRDSVKLTKIGAEYIMEPVA